MFKRVFFALILCVPAFYNATAGDGLWDEEPALSANSEKKAPDLMELPVSLREKASVDGDYILLGDLFAGLDKETENKAAAPAPSLGKDAELNADWLRALARKHGIRWEPENENVKITVRRAALEVGKDDLLKAFAQSLKEKGMPESASVFLNKGRYTFFLPPDAAYEIKISDASYAPDTYLVSGTAEVIYDGKTFGTAELSGKAVPYVKVPVAKRTLTAGQVITENDVMLKSVREDSLRATEVVAKIEDLIGKEVKRGIRAGTTVTPDDVRTQVMVAKGKFVTIGFTRGGIMLSAQGKALENGGLGDTVRVQNMQSKSVVQGIVTGPETVTVSP